MVESPSEMSYDDLKELYEKTENSLVWNAAILSVLLREAGGEIKIDRASLEGVDVTNINTTVRFDEEQEVYIVGGGFDAD